MTFTTIYLLTSAKPGAVVDNVHAAMTNMPPPLPDASHPNHATILGVTVPNSTNSMPLVVHNKLALFWDISLKDDHKYCLAKRPNQDPKK